MFLNLFSLFGDGDKDKQIHFYELDFFSIEWVSISSLKHAHTLSHKHSHAQITKLR